MFNKNKKQKPLEISLADEVRVVDFPPGGKAEIQSGPPPIAGAETQVSGRPPLTEEQKRKFMVEYTRMMGRYVAPHNKKSRRVTDKDIDRVIADGEDMLMMCKLPRGLYAGIAALAHSQIDDKDPLRFFVLPGNGLIVINPLIYGNTKIPQFTEQEGCMSFPDEPVKTLVPRYYKIQVKYQTLIQDSKDPDSKPRLGPWVEDELKGYPGYIFQHETSHLNGHNIYDKDFDPKWSIGTGDGLLIPPHLWDDYKETNNKK
jgi:peptide deformylase